MRTKGSLHSTAPNGTTCQKLAHDAQLIATHTPRKGILSDSFVLSRIGYLWSTFLLTIFLDPRRHSECSDIK